MVYRSSTRRKHENPMLNLDSGCTTFEPTTPNLRSGSQMPKISWRNISQARLFRPPEPLGDCSLFLPFLRDDIFGATFDDMS
jgi:hypothetical protein